MTLKLLSRKYLFFSFFIFPHSGDGQSHQGVLYKNSRFTLYKDSVTEGIYAARVLSSINLISDYRSPANLFKSNEITFKFSINGKDNEMPSGTDHHFTCIAKDGTCETPIIKFGTQLKEDRATRVSTFLPPDTKLKVRVDMSDVFNAFNKFGYYTTFNGNRIYKEDFKGVYIAGSSAPLIWDFDNLVHHPKLQLKDETGNHIYSATFVLNAREDEKKTDSHWELSKDISAYPQYRSPYPISDVLYNMSLEEMMNAIEPDSTLRTGKEWAGVWTRDISYSILLSMAYMQPRVAMISLMRKVNKRLRIIQDTGTGGAWPCSTDRMIWAVAAWEVYKATGDKEWLSQSFTIIKNSIGDDEHVAYDSKTGLVRGESSFLDWREQTYPKWMQPADIYQSECLGTSAVHYEANEVLAKMALLMHDKETAKNHEAIAERIKNGINRYLWMPAKGYYGQYLYGRNYKILSPRSETLGEALCIIWDIADEAKSKEIIKKMPVTDYGSPCIFPEIPGIPPYHNNAIWPFVETFYTLAAAKAGNEKAVIQGIADIYRPAALFVTNKENFVAKNGDFAGTQINSSNMLWSLSGNISLVHKVLFGLKFKENGLDFHPFVPQALGGIRSLHNFKYRNAILNITLRGFGNQISSFMVDGKPSSAHLISENIAGRHSIVITLSNRISGAKLNERQVYFSLPAPGVTYHNSTLQWQPVKNARIYEILKDGKEILSTQKNSLVVHEGSTAEYQVIALDKNSTSSFASEPVLVASKKNISIYQAEDFSLKSDSANKGFTGAGFSEISTRLNRSLPFTINIKKSGMYSIDFRYANGNGPINTENKCAIRTLVVDGKEKGAVVFPQRGKNEWSNWGFSNPVIVFLAPGKHILKLTLETFDHNMNEVTNQAMVDFMKLTWLGDR